MLHKYSIDECIEQCNKFDAENGVDDYNESILYYLQKYRDIKNSGGNGGYASPASQGVQNGGCLEILKQIIPEPYDDLIKTCSKTHTITLNEINNGAIIRAAIMLKNNS